MSRSNLRGRPRPNRKVRGHEAPVPGWPIVCGCAEGREHSQIAEEIGWTRSAVTQAAHALGIRGSSALYDFGEAVMQATVAELRQAADFLRNTGMDVGISSAKEKLRLMDMITASGHRSIRINPVIARKALLWRDVLLRTFMPSNPRQRRIADRFNRSSDRAFGTVTGARNLSRASGFCKSDLRANVPVEEASSPNLARDDRA